MSDQNSISVLILDDQLVQREGIARVVESTGNMHVLATVGSAEEAIQIFSSNSIDLALIDLVLRDQRGTQIGRELRQMQPELKVIIYTRERSMVLAAEIIRERKDIAQPGLQGYILTRNISSSHYLESVYQHIREHGYYIDPDVVRWHYELAKIEPLTHREEECALMVSEGLSNAEIARRMVITHRRVENIISSLYLKFNIMGDPGDPARRVLLAEGVRLLYSQSAPHQPIKLLIVEDLSEQLSHLQKELNGKNRLKVIATATTGQAGIDLAHQKEPDIVLIDIHLPDISGFQVARQILLDRPKTKIILQSADPNKIYEDETRRAGALALLPKNRVTASAVAGICYPDGD